MGFWGQKEEKDTNQTSDTTKQFGFSSTGDSTSKPSFLQSAATSTNTAEELKVRSALGPGTVIQGKLSFDAPVSIDGKLSGEIYSSKTLIVGKSGSVDAQVDVAVLIVKGIVKGHIKASERIEIRDSGQLLGDVVTPSLVIEEGCVFNGGCTMSSGASSANSIKKAS